MLLNFIIGCTSNQKKGNVQHTVKEEQIDFKTWNCFTIQYDRICYPRNWKTMDQQKKMFAVFMNLEDSTEMFSVVRYDIEANNLSIDNYLRIIYSKVSEDTIQRLLSYNISELFFKDRSTFFCEFKVDYKSIEYIMMGMVCEKNGLIYDISMRCLLSNKKKYHDVLQRILYLYRANNIPLFDKNDIIVEVKQVDMSTY